MFYILHIKIPQAKQNKKKNSIIFYKSICTFLGVLNAMSFLLIIVIYNSIKTHIYISKALIKFTVKLKLVTQFNKTKDFT